MKSSLAILSAGILLAWSTSAVAQEVTTFDFDAASSNQAGEYEVEAGAEMSAGTARTAARSGWALENLTARAPLVVRNDGDAVSRAVLGVPGDALPADLIDAIVDDGLRVFDEDGLEHETRWSAEWLTFRVPELAAGTSTFYAYAGTGPSGETDLLTFFMDPAPTVEYPVHGAFGSTDLTIIGFVDDTTMELEQGPVTIGRAESQGFTIVDTGPSIVSSGPLQAFFNVGDALAPESFAGRHFIALAPRDNERLSVYPLADGTISFVSPAIGDLDVAEGISLLIDAAVPDGTAIELSSTAPILVTRAADADVTPVPPASREVIGVAAGTARVAAGVEGATVTVYDSDGGESEYTVGPNEEVTVGTGGDGAGPAIRIVADQPVGGITYADGDGGEAVSFLPPEFLGQEFVVPASTDYIVVATSRPSAVCQLFDASGAELSATMSTSMVASAPGKIRLGPQPEVRLLRCTSRSWVLADETTSGFERMMIAGENHRPFVDGARPDVGAFESKFPQITAATTPVWKPPTSLLQLTAFDAVSTGSVMYQVSLDGGTTYRVPREGRFVEAVSTAGAMPDEFVDVPFDAPVSELSVRAILTSDGVTPSSVDEISLAAESTGDATDVNNGSADMGGDGGADSGPRAPEDSPDEGCCSVAAEPDSHSLAWVLLLGLLAFVRRRP